MKPSSHIQLLLFELNALTHSNISSMIDYDVELVKDTNDQLYYILKRYKYNGYDEPEVKTFPKKTENNLIHWLDQAIRLSLSFVSDRINS